LESRVNKTKMPEASVIRIPAVEENYTTRLNLGVSNTFLLELPTIFPFLIVVHRHERYSA